MLPKATPRPVVDDLGLAACLARARAGVWQVATARPSPSTSPSRGRVAEWVDQDPRR
jgi:hypothetical protein